MTLTILFENKPRERIEGVYSISDAYHRIYFHYYVPDRNSSTGVNIETKNYSKDEIVDILIDMP